MLGRLCTPVLYFQPCVIDFLLFFYCKYYRDFWETPLWSWWKWTVISPFLSSFHRELVVASDGLLKGVRCCRQNGGNKFLQTAPRNLDCNSTVYLVVCSVAQFWEIGRLGFLQRVARCTTTVYSAVVVCCVGQCGGLGDSQLSSIIYPSPWISCQGGGGGGHGARTPQTEWPPVLPSGGDNGRWQRRVTLSHRLRDSPIYTWSRVMFLLTTSMLSLAAVFLVPWGVRRVCGKLLRHSRPADRKK